jgi:non-ribosomal peptide synthetase component F
LPMLDLPTDRARPQTQTFRGVRKKIQYPAALQARVKELSRKANATVYMTLLAAFGTLLHRYSSSSDILVGSPISERNQMDTEAMIGYFINTLPIRIDLSGEPTFRQLMERVQKVALNALAHQGVPVERIVEELKIERTSGPRTPFQVVFQFSPPPPTLEIHGLSVELMDVETRTAKFDLTLTLGESAEGLVGNIEYNSDLFDEATITRFIGHYETLLAAAVANPDEKVSALNLLPESERTLVLHDWSNATTKYPRDCSLHQLFEEQATRSADAIALTFDGKQLTYGELNGRANRLAHFLQKQGVGPDTLVGFCVERSLEMIVGLLGILKAGGAYVTLDPAYPQDRISYMFADPWIPLIHKTGYLTCSPMPGHRCF